MTRGPRPSASSCQFSPHSVCGTTVAAPRFFLDDAGSDLVSRISHRTSSSLVDAPSHSPFANPSLEIIDGPAGFNVELLCLGRRTFVLIAPFLQLPAPSYHPNRRAHEKRHARVCQDDGRTKRPSRHVASSFGISRTSQYVFASNASLDRSHHLTRRIMELWFLIFWHLTAELARQPSEQVGLRDLINEPPDQSSDVITGQSRMYVPLLG
jgi:hypothetical protein